MDNANAARIDRTLRSWFDALPVETVEGGRTIIAAGETSGRIMILKDGAVEVSRDGVAIAEVTDPGVIFGELSILLRRPHTADVRTTTSSTFHVVPGSRLLEEGPGAALYVATVLAERLDRTNARLLEIRRELEREQHPPGTIAKMIESIGDSLRFGPPI